MCHKRAIIAPASVQTLKRFWRLIPVVTLAASASACGGGTPKVVPLAVKVHTTAVLTATDADLIVTGASTNLQHADSGTDVSCNTQFTVDSLGAFTTGTGVVSTKQDFDDLFDPGSSPIRQVRVVSEIYWCGAMMASAAGCADRPGNRIALVRRGADRERELWSHEIGHTKGLSDRMDSWVAVMFWQILPGHREVSATECSAYRS